MRNFDAKRRKLREISADLIIAELFATRQTSPARGQIHGPGCQRLNDLGEVVQVALGDLAGVDREHLTFGRNESGKGEGEKIDAEGTSRCHAVGLPHEDWVIEGIFFGERLHRRGPVHGDADNLGSPGFRIGLKCFEEGNLSQAGRAPGRPKVDDQGPSQPISNTAVGATEFGQAEVGSSVTVSTFSSGADGIWASRVSPPRWKKNW